jgi:sec-independent protein translocase protein TatC
MEPFSLYLKVSLYAALCLSVPFLLWQVWGFLAPGLYPHERGYVLPFVTLFAYYVLFPPAAGYLLGLGKDFKLYLKADERRAQHDAVRRADGRALRGLDFRRVGVRPSATPHIRP